jgi:hypothetical protein
MNARQEDLYPLLTLYPTFDKLTAACAWIVVEGITSGQPLKSAMFQACDMTIRWGLEVKARNGASASKAKRKSRAALKEAPGGGQ